MRHNDPVKAGNIVEWGVTGKFYGVVRYVTTPTWETEGKRWARVETLWDLVSWHEMDRLLVVKDIRERDRSLQLQHLHDFVSSNSPDSLI